MPAFRQRCSKDRRDRRALRFRAYRSQRRTVAKEVFSRSHPFSITRCMRLNIYPSETNQFAECGGIMSRNSINLIDLVKEYLGGDFTNRMSFLLGERTDKTKQGINTAIPGLLSAYDNVASTPDGARRVSSAVNDADDSILGNVSSMFGAGSGSWINRGSGILGSILGGD